MKRTLKVMAGGAALALGVLGAQPFMEEVVHVDQGWSDLQRENWYSRSQGSRLIPLSWLQALEQADSTTKFLEPSHLARFRYLPRYPANGDSTLPVGFAIDRQSDERFSEITRLRWKGNQGSSEPWVGMNCAACHTGEITLQSKRLRVDGAPAMADFQGFMRALNKALEETAQDPTKWDRFAARVLGAEDSLLNRGALRTEYAKLLRWQLQVQRANETPLAYGFARLDAFGHIFNKVALRANGELNNRNPSDAPVSYPFLWNIHQHDKVQWNGVAPNKPLTADYDVGALGRNVGEVLGVFADLQVLPFGPASIGYPTSADVGGLLELERKITKLKPPVWPAEFPPIDPDKWEKGKAVFNRTDSCAKCHYVMARDDLTTHIKAKMSPLRGPDAIGTDPWMACNAFTYTAPSGKLRFTPEGFFFGTPHSKTEQVSNLLGTVVIGAIYYRKSNLVEDLAKQLQDVKPFAVPPISPELVALSSQIFSTTALPGTKEERLATCMSQSHDTLAYKGRPLTGVWATAPFLHNGSVPTLYDLLLPPSERPTSFKLGTREFDPVKVGYANEHSSTDYFTPRAEAESSFLFQTVDASGTPIAGNSSAGHDYGNALLSDEERWALVEYMKAVGAKRVGNQVLP